MFSYVQLLILSKLLASDGLRYSEAYPAGVDGDLYNYHLQSLVKKGYVGKNKDRYFLTKDGKVAVQNMDAKGEPKDLFKVGVLLFVTRINNGKTELLLQRRRRQPYFGDVFNITGKVHLGESVEVAAKRKFSEESGLSADFKFVGIHRKIRRDVGGVVIEDVIFHVCCASDPVGSLSADTDYGENFWSNFDEAIKFNVTNKAGSTESEAIIRKIQNSDGKFFYITEDKVVNEM